MRVPLELDEKSWWRLATAAEGRGVSVGELIGAAISGVLGPVPQRVPELDVQVRVDAVRRYDETTEILRAGLASGDEWMLRLGLRRALRRVGAPVGQEEGGK